MKVEDNLLVEDKKYKGAKPRFNLKELKSMEKIAQSKKAAKIRTEEYNNKKKSGGKKVDSNKNKKFPSASSKTTSSLKKKNKK